MKTNLIRQTLYEMRTQPVAASVTLAGTALAIFLMMVVMMISSSQDVEFAPESHRSDLLFGANIEVTAFDGNSSGSSRLSLRAAKLLYDGLDGIERVAYYNDDVDGVEVSGGNRGSQMLYRRLADSEFWNVFDHSFVAGRPYDSALEKSGEHVCVLSEDAVRAVFGVAPAEAVGRTLTIDWSPYRVVGVVRSSSPLATHAYGQLFVPVTSVEEYPMMGLDVFGSTTAAMLKKPGVSEEQIRKQVKGRYALLDKELEPAGYRSVYHEQPYNQKVMRNAEGSNRTPDTESDDRELWITMLLLLLVPAVNMSAMTQSRLRRRVAETGIKRAYGASRTRIMLEILAENMLLTIAGGAVGLLLSIIGGWLLGDYVFAGSAGPNTYTGSGLVEGVDVHIPWKILIQWRVFAGALVACFILNLLSAGIPAWRASRVAPVEALRGTGA